jgi:hypothetical protein
MLRDEINRIRAKDSIGSKTLCETAVFITQTVDPCRAIFSSQESVDCFLFAEVIVNIADSVLKGLYGLDMLKSRCCRGI